VNLNDETILRNNGEMIEDSMIEVLLEKIKSENTLTVKAKNIESIDYELNCVVVVSFKDKPHLKFIDKYIEQLEDKNGRF